MMSWFVFPAVPSDILLVKGEMWVIFTSAIFNGWHPA
jgi:hypothetical protein